MSTVIYHGNIIYSLNRDELSVNDDSYIVVEDGFVKTIAKEIPAEYQGCELVDYAGKLIIPAFSDLHLHASQFAQRGYGMDKLLFDWLNDYTFPQESNFKNIEYARTAYDEFVKELLLKGTFHASVFTTIHYDACDYLFKKMDEAGLYGYVGKVNMDMNSPDILVETAEESLAETERFIKNHLYSERVKPIITPRFAPTCSDEVLEGLGKIAKKYGVGLQTHLVESLAEAEFAVACHPQFEHDAEIYEHFGLLENRPNIFAHVIFPSEKDKEILKKYGCVCVHCPEATTNVIAGIMPVDALQKEGIRIAMGCDIAGGSDIGLYKQMAEAVRLSKLKEFYEPDGNKTIMFRNAFYMATKVGGSVFDRVGSLEPGYRFNALVLDGLDEKVRELTSAEKLERFAYKGDERNIVGRYIDGRYIEI